MLYKVFGILLLSAVIYADDEDNIYYPVIKSMFEKRCIKNAGPEVAQDLLEYTKLLSKCIPQEDLVPLHGESGQERLNYVCSAFRAQAEACVEKLGTKIKPCLHPEEAYLKEFITITVNNTFVTICSEKSRKVRKDLDTYAIGKCMDLQFDLFKNCVKESGLIGAFTEPDPVVAKYELCEILLKIAKCSDESAKNKCEDKKVAEYIGSRYFGLASNCDCHEDKHKHKHEH